MRVASCICIIALEVLKYQIAYYICLSKKMKNFWIVGVASIVPLLITAFSLVESKDGRYIITSICVLIAMIFMMSGSWKQRIVNVVELLFLVLCIDEAGSMLLKLINIFYEMEYEIESWNYILVGLFTVIVLGAIARIKSSRKGVGKAFWEKIMSRLHYLVAIMALELFFAISGLGFAGQYAGNDRFEAFSLILCIVSYMSVGVLGSFVIYINRVNQKINEMLRREKILNNMQQYYYETLLEKEEDTRRYRHDIANHILCLSGLAERQDLPGVKEYLEKMQVRVLGIQQKHYITGNQNIDVITNYHVGRLKKEVNVQVIGKITESVIIDNMSLCTIYANLLENAVEELLKEGKEKFLKISLLQGREFIRISIQNSLSRESLQKKNLLYTSKNDAKNHGIGLRNVKEEVEMCGGQIKLVREGDSFIAQVILPNK